MLLLLPYIVYIAILLSSYMASDHKVFEYDHYTIRLNSDNIWPYHTTSHTAAADLYSL